MRRAYRVILGLACAGLLLESGSWAQTSGSVAPGSELRRTSTVLSITLPHFEPELPLGPGRDEYLEVCVSCHSPRYVMMQPFFPQRQWEEIVDKMGKVYGAQMDQEQRGAIVRYLVATHGPDSAPIPTAARNDEPDFAAMGKHALSVETPPPLEPATETTEHAKQVARGADVFKRDCAGCHGPAGRGDGFVGQVLLRKPKDLATTRFSRQILSQVLWNGKRGTAMPSWRGVAQADLVAVAAFVQTLHPKTEPTMPSPEILQQGRKVFVQNCAPCHGESGDGRGAGGANLLPLPASFKLKQPDTGYIMEVLREGIPGTGMPAWKDQISEADRRALAGFVRSLFEPADSQKN